ncbi:hypothetical protein [Saudi moumouvirus]|nr:hypothetical protein [Saudi moumouvirus]
MFTFIFYNMSNMIRSTSCYYIPEPRPNNFWTYYNSSKHDRRNFIFDGLINNTYTSAHGYSYNDKVLHGNITGQFALGPLASGPFVINN